LEDLDGETVMECMALTKQAIQAIGQVYKPEGFNIGANLGAVAGAGITNHIHFHVVPRWGGDTNFRGPRSAALVCCRKTCATPCSG